MAGSELGASDRAESATPSAPDPNAGLMNAEGRFCHWRDRPWDSVRPIQTSFLTGSDAVAIEMAARSYRYRGIQTIKNPFDWALYSLLLWELKPRTIFEIGSFAGGSALWLGDHLNNFGIDGHIYSIDINPVTDVSHPKVTFLAGDGRDLGQTLSPDWLASLPRPWLVIEDADHSYGTTIAVLEFFHGWLDQGDYVIVEDSLSAGKPLQALEEFLMVCGDEYEIDTYFCDFYERNMTWCLNGFLRKRTAAGAIAPSFPPRELGEPGLPEWDEFWLNWIDNCLDLYERSPEHSGALAELSNARAQYSQQWYGTPAVELKTAWHTRKGQLYQRLIASHFSQRPILPSDWEFLQDFVEYCSGLPEPESAIRTALVAIAYPIPAVDRSVWERIYPQLPDWLAPAVTAALEAWQRR
ncbi:CmcI family methyltransferase [Limnothrix redekei]|uniref:CmcI family methyltransferase n=1 Tax=Limnothrix redekei LRLZ20PSL1 TaxID=3112953 RepID=A0ABW7CB73_9CYAN